MEMIDGMTASGQPTPDAAGVDEMIPEGYRNKTLTSQAGHM